MRQVLVTTIYLLKRKAKILKQCKTFYNILFKLFFEKHTEKIFDVTIFLVKSSKVLFVRYILSTIIGEINVSSKTLASMVNKNEYCKNCVLIANNCILREVVQQLGRFRTWTLQHAR